MHEISRDQKSSLFEAARRVTLDHVSATVLNLPASHQVFQPLLPTEPSAYWKKLNDIFGNRNNGLFKFILSSTKVVSRWPVNAWTYYLKKKKSQDAWLKNAYEIILKKHLLTEKTQTCRFHPVLSCRWWDDVSVCDDALSCTRSVLVVTLQTTNHSPCSSWQRGWHPEICRDVNRGKKLKRK